MSNKIIITFLSIFIFIVQPVFGQWTYINSIVSALDNPLSKYDVWLKNNDYHSTGKSDKLSESKAMTMGSVYNVKLTAKNYESHSQPTKIYCYLEPGNNLKSIDVFLINPAKGEYENLQLVILKSGFKLTGETKNSGDATTRTYFEKDNIRINIAMPDDKSYITISASTLNYE